MTLTASKCFMLTPAGVLHAFAHKTPDDTAAALQSLLAGEHLLSLAAWAAVQPLAPDVLERGWVQALRGSLRGPGARLDDFLQHVIASLLGKRRAVLASEGGFCLGRAGVGEQEAKLLCAATADYSDFAVQQARRGWDGATRYVSFHRDPEFLLPDQAFLPFWVDGAGYWLIVMGEPLLNNPALVELLWSFKQAETRFAAIG